MLRRLFDEKKLSLPPNIAEGHVLHLMRGVLLLAGFVCSILFAVDYSEAYRELFIQWGTLRQTLNPTARMRGFHYFALPMIRVTAAFAGLSLLSVVVLYSSYYQGSRSIYLMRRLPDGRRTLRRQTASVPLCTAALLLLMGAVLLGTGYLIWRLVTPAQCLPTAENLQRVMQTIADSPYSYYVP